MEWACGLWVPGLAYTSLALWPLPQLCCPPFIRYFFNKEGDFNNLTAAAYHRKTHLLVTGFASGIFHLHELPEFNLIHSLRWAPLLCVAASSAGRGADRGRAMPALNTGPGVARSPGWLHGWLPQTPALTFGLARWEVGWRGFRCCCPCPHLGHAVPSHGLWSHVRFPGENSHPFS